MELRVDRLLEFLRSCPEDVLEAIDRDPLLLKRQSGPLILANASQALYTPQEQHQLYAKGIVYRRDPYRLVSLPLIKIYNVGERDVGLGHLMAVGDEPGVRVHFLRKFDGSLLQVFRFEGRLYFSTRGMLDGARWSFNDHDEDRTPDFDFLATARAMMRASYPRVLDDPSVLEGRTLLFEMIHPRVRKVTNYGDRADLVLIAAFDQRTVSYASFDELRRLAGQHGLNVVDALSPAGQGLAEQVDQLLRSLEGTDQEGSVLTYERGREVIYRVKVKSPDYLQLMRLMAFCTYDRTVEIIDANPHLKTWDDLRAILQEQGRDRVPEEVLVYYRQHWERFCAYLESLAQVGLWAEDTRRRIERELGGQGERTAGEYRKAFAQCIQRHPSRALIFAALDGRLSIATLRKLVRSIEEAREILAS